MDIYPDNMAAQFVNKLPKRVELDGDWSVSLKDISTPLAFNNIAFELKSETQHLKLSLHGSM